MILFFSAAASGALFAVLSIAAPHVFRRLHAEAEPQVVEQEPVFPPDPLELEFRMLENDLAIALTIEAHEAGRVSDLELRSWVREGESEIGWRDRRAKDLETAGQRARRLVVRSGSAISRQMLKVRPGEIIEYEPSDPKWWIEA